MLKNRRAPEATKAAGFASRKSYVTFAGHTHVYGRSDHLRMRIDAFIRAGGKLIVDWSHAEGLFVRTEKMAQCQLCPEPHPVSWEKGHWIHPQAYGGKRCDGCCTKFACKPAHERQHGRELI